MTTETIRPPTSAGAGVLLRAGVAGLLVVVVMVVLAALTTGRSGAGGAATGGLVAVTVFLLGSLVVDSVATIAPGLSLVFAVSTYTLQVMALGLVFVGLRRSDLLDTSLDAGWLGGTIIAVTLAWLVAQLVLTTRARIPVYDLELPGAALQPSDQASTQPSQGGGR